MINLYVKNENYNLAITLPSEYLKEELHYADVSFSTPVGGTEDSFHKIAEPKQDTGLKLSM